MTEARDLKGGQRKTETWTIRRGGGVGGGWRRGGGEEKARSRKCVSIKLLTRKNGYKTVLIFL